MELNYSFFVLYIKKKIWFTVLFFVLFEMIKMKKESKMNFKKA